MRTSSTSLRFMKTQRLTPILWLRLRTHWSNRLRSLLTLLQNLQEWKIENRPVLRSLKGWDSIISKLSKLRIRRTHGIRAPKNHPNPLTSTWTHPHQHQNTHHPLKHPSQLFSTQNLPQPFQSRAHPPQSHNNEANRSSPPTTRTPHKSFQKSANYNPK